MRSSMNYNETIESRMSKQGRKWLTKARHKNGFKYTEIVDAAIADVFSETIYAWRYRILRWRVRRRLLLWVLKILWPIGRTIDGYIVYIQNELKKGHRI